MSVDKNKIWQKVEALNPDDYGVEMTVKKISDEEIHISMSVVRVEIFKSFDNILYEIVGESEESVEVEKFPDAQPAKTCEVFDRIKWQLRLIMSFLRKSGIQLKAVNKPLLTVKVLYEDKRGKVNNS